MNKNQPEAIENKINQYNLKECSITKALTVASKLMQNNENFKVTFVNKKDESTHFLEHTCDVVEIKIDEDGKKWKRVYE